VEVKRCAVELEVSEKYRKAILLLEAAERLSTASMTVSYIEIVIRMLAWPHAPRYRRGPYLLADPGAKQLPKKKHYSLY
jgi:hypothetical protein